MILNLTPAEAVDVAVSLKMIEEILEVAPGGEGVFEGYVPDRHTIFQIRRRLMRTQLEAMERET